MPFETVDPAQVAMLVEGDEAWGIGTVEKLYAEFWPETTFVCLGRGALHDWLCARKAKVELIDGMKTFYEKNTLTTLARVPLMFQRAKRDARRIHERLAGRGIRIIHAHWRVQQIMAGYLRRQGYRSVWHLHNSTSRTRLFGLGLKLNHLSARWGADLLLPVSNYIAANWLGCGVPHRVVLNCAVPLFPTPSNLPLDGPVRSLVAGRIEVNKGIHVAVDAVAAARRAGCDVTLDVIGGPLENNPYADRLRQRIADGGLGSVVRLLGFRDDLRQMHQQYHLGLHCSVFSESCSMWVCETLVDGLPLLASSAGGTPELVDDGVTGFLYPPGSVNALAQRLIQLSRDRRLLANMRPAAFERGARMFTVQRFLDETLAAYASMFDAAPATAGATLSPR